MLKAFGHGQHGFHWCSRKDRKKDLLLSAFSVKSVYKDETQKHSLSNFQLDIFEFGQGKPRFGLTKFYFALVKKQGQMPNRRIYNDCSHN